MSVELRAVCDLCGEGGPVLDGMTCTSSEAIVEAGLIHDGNLIVHASHDVMTEDEQHAAQAELERYDPEGEFVDPAEAEAERKRIDEWMDREDMRAAHYEALREAAERDPRDYL